MLLLQLNDYFLKRLNDTEKFLHHLFLKNAQLNKLKMILNTPENNRATI